MGLFENVSQKEICKKLIEVRHLLEFFDDGHHREEEADLTKISNLLFEHLNPTNQRNMQEWIKRRFHEIHGE